MVKSNKFDYTGRTSSGPKLGKSIAADLEKRAEKKQREAQKTSARMTFKSHFPTARSSKKKDQDAGKDGKDDKDTSKHDMHKLDIKVPGKALSDEGFALLCDGLEKALDSCLDLALVDFNASDNSLSTHSLARLAPIICRSNFNLQTLDLSKNNFQVSTTADARDWELFLCAFHDCMTLRRLDLSDNPSLGHWAFEILARVYSQEPPVDPLPATGAQSLITLPDDELPDAAADTDTEEEDNDQAHDCDDDELPRCANGKTLADTWVLGYRRGLRSIPYLTLANVGLSDTGALFLSYVLEQHYYPIQLITETNASDATSLIRTYRQDANLKGIDWDDNLETLGKDGVYVLQCAEKQRARNFLGDVESLSGSAYDVVHGPEVQEPAYGPKKSYPTNGRRASFRSTNTVDYSQYDRSDIGTARKRIQRNTIAHAGSGSVEFWHAALKAIASSRLLYMIVEEPPNPAEHTHDASQGRDGSDIDLTASVTSLASYEDVRSSLYSMSLKQNLPPIEESQQSKRSYAATLMTTSPRSSDEPELPITDVTNAPVAPIIHSTIKFVSASRKDGITPDHQKRSKSSLCSSPSGSASNPSSNLLDAPVEREDGPGPYLKHQTRHMQDLQELHGGHSDGYRDSSLRCQLPLTVGLRILDYTMAPDILRNLTDQQRRAAFAWGQKRQTLRSELEWMGKDESWQILMLLARAECVDC